MHISKIFTVIYFVHFYPQRNNNFILLSLKNVPSFTESSLSLFMQFTDRHQVSVYGYQVWAIWSKVEDKLFKIS